MTQDKSMTLDEAQNVAFRMANLNSLDITLLEIRQALVVLANFYEDYKLLAKEAGNE
jgi:hypothetical protein